MNAEKVQALLQQVAAGKVPPAQAIEQLRSLPLQQLSFATLDHHRALRCGHAEVIFCPGKTVQQVILIARHLVEAGQQVLATRLSDEQMSAVMQAFPLAAISQFGRAAIINETLPQPPAVREAEPYVALVSAGTADLPVVEEAAMTLRSLRAPALRFNDVGVSGIHRILSHVEPLQQACAVIVVAGMEGALPSVVGGLVACPVYAVPTSIGYGASFNGLAALLGMLNSCASNVSVVNIDNGFGAAYSAGLLCQQVRRFMKNRDNP